MKTMKQTLFYARNFLLFPTKFNTNPNLPFIQVISLNRHRLRFRLYSSQSNSSNLPRTQKNNGLVDVEDVSNEELRRRIDKYLEGDADVIPSIFEAILSRKLAGKHEESDDELIEEIRGNTQHSGNEEEEEEEEEMSEDL